MRFFEGADSEKTGVFATGMAPPSVAVARVGDWPVVEEGLKSRKTRENGLRNEGTEGVTLGEQKVYSLAEIAKHDMPNDCWLIIHGKVYDVTSWVPRHPGGSLIHVRAGGDCTHLFESYHPLYVKGLLGKYCVGEIMRSKDEALRRKKDLLQYGNDSQPNEFYRVVKQRVEAYLKEKKINPRISPSMYVKSFLILFGYVFCYYGAFFLFSANTLASILCAIGMGFLAAEVGVSIQHDSNHGAYAPWQSLCYFMGVTLDLVGASSFMWRQQHVVGHHQYTNVNEFDPDIRVKDPDARRVMLKQPWQWYQSYQHIYLGILYGVLALKSIFLDDFTAYFSGQIGNVRISRMTPLETTIFFGGKLVYVFYMFVLTALWGTQPKDKFFALYILSQLVTGWALAFMFQVAHIVEDAQFPEADKSGDVSKVPMGWAAAQVATSTGFSHGSKFWTHISGGLNYQIEHHLFPGMCHTHYPLIQPIVAATCKEFHVPYHVYPTFWSALHAHFAWLQKVGASGVEWRLSG